MDSGHPVQFSVSYPDRDLNRLTSFFRVFTVIPIAIVLAALSGAAGGKNWGGGEAGTGAAIGGGLLFILRC